MLVLALHSGRVIAANQAAQNAYGYSQAELLARTIHDLSGTADGSALLCQCGNEVSWTGPWSQRRKDGSHFGAEIGVLEVRWEARQPAAMIIVERV
jgi:PAS domain S-box-containing protein